MKNCFYSLSLFLKFTHIFIVLFMEIMLTRKTLFVKTCGYEFYPNWKCLKKVVVRLLFCQICRRQNAKFILRKNQRKSSKTLSIIVAKKYIPRLWFNSFSYVDHVNWHRGCSCCILTINRSYAKSRYCFTLTVEFLGQKNFSFLYTVLTLRTYKTFRFARRRNGVEIILGNAQKILFI